MPEQASTQKNIAASAAEWLAPWWNTINTDICMWRDAVAALLQKNTQVSLFLYLLNNQLWRISF